MKMNENECGENKGEVNNVAAINSSDYDTSKTAGEC